VCGQIGGWSSESELAKILGSRLKRLREEQGLNQGTLARHLGISKSSIAKYEAGVHTPPASALMRLAATLNVTLDGLLGSSNAGPRPLRDPRLVRCMREIEAMDEQSLKHVVLTLEALVKAYHQLCAAGKASTA
jgi:transcriptional regulator with XRE-family HTH domain